MDTINARQARKRFSELLNQAARGEAVTISRHGRDIARIVPAEPEGRPKLPNLAKFRAGITVTGSPASQDVIAARDEERY